METECLQLIKIKLLILSDLIISDNYQPHISKMSSKLKTGVGTPTSSHHGTTTISTIAVQSGDTKLVIALLQSGPREFPSLTLRVLEMQPEFAWLGNNFAEAGALQKSQIEVINKLHSKQSPVEELLRQADQMIVTQQPRAEVYSAMAESLGTAWKDLNRILEERRILLDLNHTFQGHYTNFLNKADELLTQCFLSEKESTAISPKEVVIKLKKERREMLEMAVYALQVKT